MRASCDENKRLGKELEIFDPVAAAKYYKKALFEVDEYAALIFDNGLFGRFSHEYSKAQYGSDAIKILDRISLLLCKMSMQDEARSMLEKVFEKYPEIVDSKGAEFIKKRISKALKLQIQA